MEGGEKTAPELLVSAEKDGVLDAEFGSQGSESKEVDSCCFIAGLVWVGIPILVLVSDRSSERVCVDCSL